jgi:CO/xanthine dehydrogenase Mo-binding subunit
MPTPVALRLAQLAAAIANAIFDATDVRVRRVPVSPDRVKMALS